MKNLNQKIEDKSWVKCAFSKCTHNYFGCLNTNVVEKDSFPIVEIHSNEKIAILYSDEGHKNIDLNKSKTSNDFLIKGKCRDSVLSRYCTTCGFYEKD